jgi:hypothetical protein
MHSLRHIVLRHFGGEHVPVRVLDTVPALPSPFDIDATGVRPPKQRFQLGVQLPLVRTRYSFTPPCDQPQIRVVVEFG